MLIAVAREIIRETPLPKLVLVFSRPSQIWIFGPELPILLGGAQLQNAVQSISEETDYFHVKKPSLNEFHSTSSKCTQIFI